jgi:hypothetical protein
VNDISGLLVGIADPFCWLDFVGERVAIICDGAFVDDVGCFVGSLVGMPSTLLMGVAVNGRIGERVGTFFDACIECTVSSILGCELGWSDAYDWFEVGVALDCCILGAIVSWPLPIPFTSDVVVAIVGKLVFILVGLVVGLTVVVIAEGAKVSGGIVSGVGA